LLTVGGTTGGGSISHWDWDMLVVKVGMVSHLKTLPRVRGEVTAKHKRAEGPRGDSPGTDPVRTDAESKSICRMRAMHSQTPNRG
jgi:hypothetical protein